MDSKKEGRVIYDDPSSNPKESLHWKRLPDDGDISNIHNHEELLQEFQRDVDSLKSKSNKENYQTLALWSCIIGYCEALTTHKDGARRYAIFPIPLDSIRRLVHDEFLPLLNQAQDTLNNSMGKNITASDKEESLHRQTVRSVANAIWKRAQNKNNNMQDELHANTLYTCLCGDVDGKSLDCFGSALLVVLGMNILGFSSSCLTLSEDHAYESHLDNVEDGDNNNTQRATCEVAIPGNTKSAQSKRGKDISSTFEQCDNITAETSWLYMDGNAVVCDTGMTLAALVGNLNCDINKQKTGAEGKPQLVSRPLYKIKRDLLWILHEHEHMTKFPFALMELGETEEHLSSERGLELVDATEMLHSKRPTEILRNEQLFIDAIHISKTVYKDAQVYPYLYCAHYHRDAGRDDQDEEYRLVESLRLYAEAARVASTYRYATRDCMQLMKHFTTVVSLIVKDILLLQSDEGNTKAARQWQRPENCVAAATWLIAFFDSLLLWEETEQKQFVEVLSVQNKHSAGKLFHLFPVNARIEAIAKIHSQEEPSAALAITEEELLYFRSPRAKRFAKGSLLLLALSKQKVVIRELEMALPSNNCGGRSTRQRKKART
jgi:hypothetical protein